jgi:hypothetical protein
MNPEKEQADKLLDNLPNKTTWDKKMFELGVNKKKGVNHTESIPKVKSGAFKEIKQKLLKKITGK